MSKRWIAALCLLLMLTGCAAPSISSSSSASESVVEQPKEPRFTDSLKVLAIGNSFTQNGVTYMYDVAKDLGIDQVVIANLYYGGCEISWHVDFHERGQTPYAYYKNTDGQFVVKQNYSLADGVTDEDWDVIIMHQTSAKAGQDTSYFDVDDLVGYVREYNADAELWWHMSWAYNPRNPLDAFDYYNNDQQTMYDKIVGCVQGSILPLELFAGVIPSATAFQNYRAVRGNELESSDLHHANDTGCYLLALTWVGALTNLSPADVTWMPDGMTADVQAVCLAGAADALATPYQPN